MPMELARMRLCMPHTEWQPTRRATSLWQTLGNDTIRKVTPAGAWVTTIAGLAGESVEYDGVGGAARFSEPVAVATDSTGNVLVLEADNIREVAPSGVVTTIAGAVFGPWHFQDQFCEWDVPPENSGAARSGTRRCSLNIGTTYCSSSIEVPVPTRAAPGPKLNLVYDGAHAVTAVDTKFKVERCCWRGAAVGGDPNPGGSAPIPGCITLSESQYPPPVRASSQLAGAITVAIGKKA